LKSVKFYKCSDFKIKENKTKKQNKKRKPQNPEYTGNHKHIIQNQIEEFLSLFKETAVDLGEGVWAGGICLVSSWAAWVEEG
jgi:hypothetical protein